MEITCTRCHQAVKAEDIFCPTCGLPQLVYSQDAGGTTGQAERWTEAVRDASMVDWRSAMRAALLLAVPAGLLSSGLSPVGLFGLLWMAASAAWAVVLYVRSQRPGWITIGAGARIGLVTGLAAAWLAFSIGGIALFAQRFVFHDTGLTDGLYNTYLVEPVQQVLQGSIAQMEPADAAQAQAMAGDLHSWLLSPWGHAGMWMLVFSVNSLFLLFFAIGGGALGARLSARMRRPEL